MCYFVEHNKAHHNSTCLKEWPTKFLEHSCDTIVTSVIVEARPCCKSLDVFELFVFFFSTILNFG